MRTNLLFAPRTPRPTSAATTGTDLGARGGRPIAFSDAGTRWHPLRPVDRTLCQAVPSGFTRPCGPFATFRIPRVGPFHPRVTSFLPHVRFSPPAALSHSLSNFLEERERRKRAGASERPSTGLNSCNKSCPRVGRSIHGFSVDEKRGNRQCWRGFAAVLALDPRSTGRNAWVPPARCSVGGLRHGR